LKKLPLNIGGKVSPLRDNTGSKALQDCLFVFGQFGAPYTLFDPRGFGRSTFVFPPGQPISQIGGSYPFRAQSGLRFILGFYH
jgi:hypothetical protein